MSLTPFFIIFSLLLFISFKSPRAWLICFFMGAMFQAATPFLLTGGGRNIGINCGYILMFSGFFHVIKHYSSRHNWHNAPLPVTIWLLLAFLLYGIFGALLFPLFFKYEILVMSPRFGLDSGFLSPLTPGTGNIIQALYLALNFLVLTAVYVCFRCRMVTHEDLHRAVSLSLVLVVGIGFYQIVAHELSLPWPEQLINSNIGLRQNHEQTAMGLKRISSTFIEPSVLSVHLLGLVSYLYFYAGSITLLVTMGLIAMILSTSSLAYLGLLLLSCVISMRAFKRGELRPFVSLLGLLVLMAVGFFVDFFMNDGALVNGLLFEKMESSSGVARSNADINAFHAFIDSYALGVGVGSTRASSLLATLLATTGGIGTLLFFSSILIAVRRALKVSQPAMAAVAAAGMPLLLMIISIPDLSLPFFWAMLGAIMAMAEDSACDEKKFSHQWNSGGPR